MSANPLNEVEQQLKSMQQKLNEIKEKQLQSAQYNGPNIKIKIVVGNTSFISDSRTLFAKQHGNTLFMQRLSPSKSATDIEGNLEESKSEQVSPVKELYFARNPAFFQYILDYLSGYDLKYRLRERTVIELERILSDAQYFQIHALYEMVTSSLHSRFNPFMKSPILKLSDHQTCVTRGDENHSLNQTVAVYGVMRGACKRYVEFTVISAGNLYVKLGVAEANPFRITNFPGRPGHPGCSFLCEDGRVFANGGGQALSGSKSKYGDRIGVGVEMNEQTETALVGFYVNGKLQQNKLNLKGYMDVERGVVFVVSLYTPHDCVVINQDVIIPKAF